MAGTRVDPPPLNTPIIDGRGFATPAMRDFLHRLWQRTGGNDDELSTVISLMTNGGYQPASSNSREERIEQGVVQLSLQGSGASALREEMGSLQALLHAKRGEDHGEEAPPISLAGVGQPQANTPSEAAIALLYAQAQRQAGEIAALREELDALRHATAQRSSNAESGQAAEDASAAQVLLFTNAMPQGTPY